MSVEPVRGAWRRRTWLATAFGIAVVVAQAPRARADATPTHVLRFATIAPDGTEWARLSRSFSREVAQETGGDVQVKWYFGAIAGDESAMIERVRRGQLDGAASGGMMCQRLAPSLRVIRIVGLFQNRQEAMYVLSRLKPRLDRELSEVGFVNLGEAGFGSDVLFSREPVRSFDDFRRQRWWIWDLDDVYRRELTAMGMHVAALPVEAALPAFEASRIDGFIGISTAALAYQWTTRARYFSDLHIGYLMGCMVMSQAAFDPLPLSAQKALRDAGGKLMRQMENRTAAQDEALLGGLFQRQGMTRVPVSETLQAEFFDAARAVRDRLGNELTSPSLLVDVTRWLADYRSERR